MTPASCPECSYDMYGKSVEFSSEFSSVVGCVVPEVYDGVLFWMCPKCTHAWPRFEGTHGLGPLSRTYVDKHNARGAA